MILRIFTILLALPLWMMAPVATAQEAPLIWHIQMPDPVTDNKASADEAKAAKANKTNAVSGVSSRENSSGQGSSKQTKVVSTQTPQHERIFVPAVTSSLVAMSNQQAKAWLDYKLYERVEAGMRTRLKKDIYDGVAWRLLAESLAAQGRTAEAAEARQRSREYGDGQRQWHISLRLAGLVDSNVVVAPDAIHLAAQDQGDIGGRVALAAYGRLWQQDWGYTAWQLGYEDMLYQDFNTFAVRKLHAALSEHVVWGDDVDVSLGLRGEQASLGGNSFYAGWQTTASLNMPLGKQTQFGVGSYFGRRNFTGGFGDFSAWRWQVKPRLTWMSDHANAAVDISIGKEQTRLGFEAYRQFGAGVSAGWLAFDWGEHGDIWLQGRTGLTVRNYQSLDNRAFLKSPIKRKDYDLKLIGAVAWQRPTTVWGGGIAEIWQLQAGWRRNTSNMDVQAVFDPAQAREWKQWWSEVSVQWTY